MGRGDERKRVADDLRRVEKFLREWDPIGVKPGEPDGAPADEYDAYAPHSLGLLADGCEVQKLAAYLEDCRTRNMGLRADPAADLATSTKMLEWWNARMEPRWHPFCVDGETLHWRTYPSKQKTGEGLWEPCEHLSVARVPDAPGVGASHPAGTAIGEEHAIALVHLFKEHGRPIP